MRARKIIKYGNTTLIRLKPNDLKDMGWEYGDKIDIDKCEILK